MNSEIHSAALWAKPWLETPQLGGVIKISEGLITAVDKSTPIGDLLVIPGLVNAHDHGRGVAPLTVGVRDAPLEAWLWDLWRVPSTDPYLTALVAFGQMALSGVTTVVHNHLPQGQNLVEEAKAVAQAATDVGLRLAFVAPVLDQNLSGYDGGEAIKSQVSNQDWKAICDAQVQLSIEEQIEQVREVRNEIDGPQVITQFGPPGPQWLSNIGWKKVGKEASEDWRIHVHLLETLLQRKWLDSNSPLGAAAFFNRFGLLNERLTIAHGVFLNPEEIVAFTDAGVTLILNTSSNLRLRSGIVNSAEIAASGIRLGIGLDGLALDDDADMLREVRITAALLGPRRFDQSGLTKETILCSAFSDGHVAFDGTVAPGIEVGAGADIVGLSLNSIASDRINNEPRTIASLAVGRWRRSMVREVWVGGRHIVANGCLTGFDYDAAVAELTANVRSSSTNLSWIDRAREASILAGETAGK